MTLYEQLTPQHQDQLNSYKFKMVAKKLIEVLKSHSYKIDLPVVHAAELHEILVSSFKPFSLLEYYSLFNNN
jgi:hypothetical protein